MSNMQNLEGDIDDMHGRSIMNSEDSSDLSDSSSTSDSETSGELSDCHLSELS